MEKTQISFKTAKGCIRLKLIFIHVCATCNSQWTKSSKKQSEKDFCLIWHSRYSAMLSDCFFSDFAHWEWKWLHCLHWKGDKNNNRKKHIFFI